LKNPLFCKVKLIFLNSTRKRKRKKKRTNEKTKPIIYLQKKMGLEEDFKQAAETAKKLSQKPKDEDMLLLYGLYKQANEGDCNTDRPGFFDMTGKYKW
jgi:hypothetical protein